MSDEAPLAIKLLAEHAKQIQDFRCDLGKRYPLWYVIVLAVIAVVGGADSWLDIAAFWEARTSLHRRLFAHDSGIPAHDTFRRVFILLPFASFQRCLKDGLSAMQAAGLLRLEDDEVLAADGKVLRGSHDPSSGQAALQMVTVYATKAGVVLAQGVVRPEAASNEIAVLPEVLKQVRLRGHVMVTDAAHTQKRNARHIKRRGGEYVFALKGNHARLYEALRQTWQQEHASEFGQVQHEYLQTEERGHGRRDRRAYWLVSDPAYLTYFAEEVDAWPNLGAVGFVRRQRRVGQTEREQVSFFVTGLKKDVKRFARAVRAYWRIENGEHWVLDVMFGEDLSRVRTGYSAENFAGLRRVALSILTAGRSDEEDERAIKARRLRAARSDDFLLTVLACAAQNLKISDA
ncbi:MAG: ISAs1 family transposase [Candidatus Brachytrichaceae bacterium NZ_4S206]|jgi:predicted transposase YbfD/YdcC